MIFKLKRNILLLTIALIGSFMWGYAAETSAYPLGYCNGEITTNAIVKFDGANVEVSGAIYIPSSYATTVEGNNLTAINVGIGSTRNISDVRVWVRQDLNGPDIVEGGSLPKIVQGWNEVELDNPLSISNELVNSGFYIGFSFIQSFKSAGLAALSIPSENGMWVQCGDGAWENRSSEGILCLEGLVYGESLPVHNVHVESISVDKWYIIDNGILNGVITLRNLATETINNIEIEAQFPGINGLVTTSAPCSIAYNEVEKVPFSMEVGAIHDEPRQITGTFTVSKVNGEADEDMTDNTASAGFSVIQSAFPRKVLLEEFTTESCSNCPRVAGFIHDMLADPVYSNRVEAICHHSGFGLDQYSIRADEAYTWFYNSTTTYAPAIMLDRDLVEYDHTPVFLPSSTQVLEDKVDLRLEQPAVISVEVEANLKDDNTVAAVVTGNVIDKDLFCENPRITVYLVEDNIETTTQAGAGSSFTHMHVTRQVNEAWGDPLSFNSDNTYFYSCELTYKPEYKFEDMKVVAVISNYNSEDPTDCLIENCGSVSLSESAGIKAIGQEYSVSDQIYTIQGIKKDRIDSKGLYIINGKKVLVR